MKSCVPALLTLALLAAAFPARAQSDMIIKQRAKQIQNNNNAQQGVTPAPANPPPAAPAPPPPPQGISTSQQQLIDKLGADFSSITPGSSPTAEQKQSLETDVLTLAKGMAKPSKELVTKLAADLSTALSDRGFAPDKQKELAKDINVVVNSMNLAPQQVQTFVTSAQTILKSGGLEDPQVQGLVADLKAIIADLQKSKPKLYQ